MSFIHVGSVQVGHAGRGHRGGRGIGPPVFGPAYGYPYPYPMYPWLPSIPSKLRKTQAQLDRLEAELDEKEARLEDVKARRRALAEHSEGIWCAGLGR